MRATYSVIAAAVISMASGCTAWQTQENALDQISTLQDIRYSQLLTNLSNAIDRSNMIDHKDPVPSQAVASSGTATNVATGSLAFTFTQPFDFAHNVKTFTPMAMINWQNNWTMTPISDPQDLQNLRSLYALLYETDHEIAQFIIDTLKLFAAQTGSIDPKWMATHVQECGVSGTEIENPSLAAESYFGAWSAFPVDPKDLNKVSKCFANYGRPLGVASTTSLATQYGLAYPDKQDVLAAVRNGLSPNCRSYQLANLVVTDPKNPQTQKFRQDTLFERWLFWKSSSGGWAPYPPPTEPEWLGKYGNHDFWTTSRACLNDFIVVGINATANSHAAAQNSQKGGPTSATLGSQ